MTESANEPTAGDAADPCHYGQYYYENCCGSPYGRDEQWLGLFRLFAGRIAGDIAPRSVLDAGCAMGLLVEALAQRGVDAEGVDISDYAIERVADAVRDRCRVGSILEPFGRRYDLIVSIEVVEHLQPADAERAIANFCAHADDVLLSTTPFDYKEASHFNVRPPEYWAGLFARHGFFRDVDYDASYITRWAARYRRESKTAPRIVADYERTHWRLLQENLGARESLMEHQARLIAVETELAASRARAQALQTERDEARALLGESRASEADLSATLEREIGQWSRHARNLEEFIRQHAEATQAFQDAFALSERLREEADARWQDERAAAEAARIELQARLDALSETIADMQGSRAWQVADRVGRFRSRLAARAGVRLDRPHE